MDNSLVIDQVALTIAHNSNTINQTMDNRPSIGSVFTLHSCCACSVIAMPLPIAVLLSGNLHIMPDKLAHAITF